MASTKRTKKKASNRPIYKARAGRISCAVFVNDGDSGSFYSITPQRVYEDEDGELQNTGSFNESDLPTLGALLDECWEFCRTNPMDEKPAKRSRSRDDEEDEDGDE